MSRSPSPTYGSDGHTGQSQLLSKMEVGRKRRRDSSTSIPYDSASPNRGPPQDFSRGGLRKREQDAGTRKRRQSKSRSISSSSDVSFYERRRSRSRDKGQSKRRRHSSRSPVDRGRNRDVYNSGQSRRARSPSDSRDRGEVLRNRKSMTPNVARSDEGFQQHYHRSSSSHSKKSFKNNHRYGNSTQRQDGNSRSDWLHENVRPPRTERSLSPFSKRLAMTQAMNMGR
ncbi:hypothetical protein ACLMJK_007281 [Lecanora helva]